MIHFRNSNLRIISAADLKPFPDLIYLSMQFRTKLSEIDGDLFKYTPKLQLVAFAGSIHHFGYNLLENLGDLQHVGFQSPCLNMSASNPEEIEELKRKLTAQCPPLQVECADSCLERFKVQEKEIAEIKISFEDRIVELEKQVRELASRPCSVFK